MFFIGIYLFVCLLAGLGYTTLFNRFKKKITGKVAHGPLHFGGELDHVT